LSLGELYVELVGTKDILPTPMWLEEKDDTLNVS
jgi:hypothetical protein